jgi:4-hydroxybenzoate-CoA ligase
MRPEERAALIALDTLDWPVIFWGCLKAGVVPVAVNTLLTAEQYRHVLADSRARALFVSAPLLGTVRPALEGLPHLRQVFVLGGEGADHAAGGDFAAELAASDPAPTAEVGPDDCAFWLYSSGSTGQPKGVRHVHSSMRGTAETYGARVLGIREGDIVFSAAKLFFAYGLGNSMSFPMSVGATAALLPGRPTPDAVFGILQSVQPTIFCGVPTLFAAMLAAAGERVPGTDRLRVSISAGEALPAEIGQRWRRLTGTDILDGVGSTEMLHIFLSNAPGDVEYGTSGRAVPGYELRLVGEWGREVGEDEIGEMLVRGDTAADGYWNQRAKSRATFEGAWTRTGDKYTRRADGRYVYCGRTDDMFKVSGQWVSPFEVEQALIAHPSVLEAAVVAAKDADGLEKPKAFVVPRDRAAGIDAAALQEHVKGAIGPWKYPRWIEVTDELPKTATGKIQRFKLRG